MRLSQSYQFQLNQQGFEPDEAQSQIVAALESLAERMGAGRHKVSWGLLGALLRTEPHTVKGCYIWGGVGRGKTWLMDLFFNAQEIAAKHRCHFASFMQKIHQELEELGSGTEPLRRIAEKLSRQYRLLCLDEFMVTDIADAMLLGGLLKELFAQGVVVVMTSNQEPDGLYKNGLQRDRFLPAIDLIKRHMQVVELRGDVDHRAQNWHKKPSYLIGENFDFEQWCTYLDKTYDHSNVKKCSPVQLEIGGRFVQARAAGDNYVWFEFEKICGDGRATSDYLELAQHFKCFVLTSVPVLGPEQEDMARRFVHLVDILYDNTNHLIVGAQERAAEIYQGRLLQHDFKRTVSRLQHMARHHL